MYCVFFPTDKLLLYFSELNNSVQYIFFQNNNKSSFYNQIEKTITVHKLKRPLSVLTSRCLELPVSITLI